MLDLIQLQLTAGDGGHGRVSFRREKYIPKGGPDGGNGGAGGSIILRGNKNLSTLGNFAGIREVKAQPGENGGARKKIGGDAPDLYVEVPVGTIVWLLSENQESYRVRMRALQPEGSRQYLAKMEQYWIDGGRGMIPTRDEDPMTSVVEYAQQEMTNLPMWREDSSRSLLNSLQPLKLNPNQPDVETVQGLQLIEITEHGQEIVLCKGGKGGKGNVSFANASHTTPWEAEYGQRGEKKEVIFELRLLADVGLVGFPNAGKSTFLSKITRANPKIANYPFTTLEPNLGIWLLAEGQASSTSYSRDDDRKNEVVIADIPGLIEGASQGKGLGLKFLRHVERCQMLLFLLALEESFAANTTQSNEEKAAKLWQDYQTLLQELKTYRTDLIEKPRIISINKIDLYDEELIKAIQAFFKKENVEVQLMSTITGAGLDEVKSELRNRLS